VLVLTDIRRGHDILPLELEGVDPLSTRVFQALLRTIHLQRQLMVKALAEKSSHPAQAFCLRLIAENDGISQRELADTLYLSRPRITSMLQAMEKDGLITRSADEADQRLTRVFLTDEGRRLDHELRSLSSMHVNETLGALSEADRRDLERLLGELAEHISRALDREEETEPGR
jgi:DNA-binding MarR family transcriptional regulator